MSNKVFAGIDDGHDGIKIFLNNEMGETFFIRLESIAQIGEGNIVEVSQQALNEMMIYVDQPDGTTEHYMVDNRFVVNKLDTRTSDYAYNDLNIALVVQALRKISGNVDNLNIVAGLPASRYYDKAHNTKNQDIIDKKNHSLKNMNRAYSPADNRRFNVQNVDIAPEGYGAAFDLMFDDRLKPTEYFQDISDYGCIIVDIGGRTVDVVKVMAKTCLPIGSELLSFDKGVLFLKDKVGAALSEHVSASFTLNDNLIERAMKTGWIGRVNTPQGFNVSEIISSLYKSHVDSIYHDIRDVLNSNEAFGGVIFAGGGSYLLGELLKNKIETSGNHRCHVTIADKPEFANAKGFWKVARRKFKD